MKKLAEILNYSGLAILGLGILLGFLDLRGSFKDADKIAIKDWATRTKTGLSIETPAAQKFLQKFPPPNTETDKKVTHLTKQVIGSELGGAMLISVNYMYEDLSRSSYVANISDIEDWINETPYPWISWSLSLVGFLEVLGSFITRKKIERSEIG